MLLARRQRGHHWRPQLTKLSVVPGVQVTFTTQDLGNYFEYLNTQLAIVYERIERDEGAIVTEGAKNLVQALVIESLWLRRVQWQTAYGLDVRRPEDLIRTVDIAMENAQFLLSRSPRDSGQDRTFLSTSGLISQIHEFWCGYFPLCRGPE